MAADVTIVAALLAGLVSFLSPCVLPLVPPYLVYLAGASLERLADAEPAPQVRRETIAAALLFVAGFSTVFVSLGAAVRRRRIVEIPVTHRPRPHGRSTLQSGKLARFCLLALRQLIEFRVRLSRSTR